MMRLRVGLGHLGEQQFMHFKIVEIQFVTVVQPQIFFSTSLF